MKHKRKNAGFTLAELLIVIAIIAVLIATAIPAYIAQLNRSKMSVDSSTVRAAESLASADYQLEKRSGWVYYSFKWDTDGSHALVIGNVYEATPARNQPANLCTDAYNDVNGPSFGDPEFVASERYPNDSTRLVVRCKEGGVSKGMFVRTTAELSKLFPGAQAADSDSGDDN